jgi:hypothetical protein
MNEISCNSGRSKKSKVCHEHEAKHLRYLEKEYSHLWTEEPENDHQTMSGTTESTYDMVEIEPEEL